MTPAEPRTLREARQAYLDANGLGDGGYDDRWVVLKAGPVPIVFPNSKARVAALRLHDCHHPLTGYDTSWIGEAEIGAWEISTGCGRFVPAWILNLYAMGIGLVLAPARSLRAWMRGRSSDSLYHRGLDNPTLDRPLGELRAELGLVAAPPPASLVERVKWFVWSITGLAALVVSWTGPTIVLVGLLVTWWRA